MFLIKWSQKSQGWWRLDQDSWIWNQAMKLLRWKINSEKFSDSTKEKDVFSGKQLGSCIKNIYCGNQKRRVISKQSPITKQWISSVVDKESYRRGIFMNLFKAFGTINHELLLPKLHAYGFNKDVLKGVYNYLKNRYHRTKTNKVSGFWSEIFLRVP